MCFFWKKKKKQNAEQVANEQKVVVNEPVEEKQAEVVEEPVVEKKQEAEVKVEAKEVKEPAKKEEVAEVQEEVAADNTKKAKVERKGRFVYRKTDKGNYVYKLYSSNHRVIAIGGEPYSSLASMKVGISSIIKNASTAPVEDQTLQNVVEQKCPKWELYLDAKGEYRFRLKASNGNIVCITNDGYLSKPACKNGMQAIAKAAMTADIVQEEDEK